MKSKIIKRLKFIFSRKFIILLLLVIQIGFLSKILINAIEYSQWLNAVLVAIGLVTALIIINNDNYTPEYKIAWIIPVLMFPAFSGIAYLFLHISYERPLFKKILNKKQKVVKEYLPQNQEVLNKLQKQDKRVANLATYMYKAGQAPVYRKTQSEFFASGETLFSSLKKELLKAEHFIFIEYFIIDQGDMWNEILEILLMKVKQGVDVRIMYDGMGSKMILPDGYNTKLCKTGIKCKVFNPFRPFLSTIQNNRDHRKIVIIDGHTAFTGGMNIADEYINKKKRFGHWKDSGIMLQGNAVWKLTTLFLELWEPQSNNENYYDLYSPHLYLPREARNDGYIIPFGDSPLDKERIGISTYLNIINNAKDYVYFSTPYLIPDNKLIYALQQAAKSGVDVRIITPKIPDKWYTHLVTQSYYSTLIETGVKIYEYQDGFIHSKNYVSDDTTAIVGTINTDYRSLFLHFECGVYLYKSTTVMSIKEDFLRTLNFCKEISLDDCKKQSPVKRFIASILKAFNPLL